MSNVPGDVLVAMLVKHQFVSLPIIDQNGSHQTSYKKDTDTMEVEHLLIQGKGHINTK